MNCLKLSCSFVPSIFPALRLVYRLAPSRKLLSAASFYVLASRLSDNCIPVSVKLIG